MLDTLGLKMILIKDDDAAARTLALRTPVQSSQQRFDNVSRISAKPSPPPPLLTIVGGAKTRRGGKYG